MPVYPPSPEHYAAVEAVLAEHYATRPPEVVNLENALELVEPAELTWRGTVFTVPPISWRGGVKLSRIQITLGRIYREPPQTIEALDELDRVQVETLDLLWSFLAPRPSENPFSNASPSEVGQLLGFFSVLQTKRPGGPPVRAAIGSSTS